MPEPIDELDEFLTWVMANRDVGARYWTDTIEPELRRQLQQLVEDKVLEAFDSIFGRASMAHIIHGEQGELVINKSVIKDYIDQLQTLIQSKVLEGRIDELMMAGAENNSEKLRQGRLKVNTTLLAQLKNVTKKETK